MCLGSIPSEDAEDHIGESTGVLCRIVSTQYLVNVTGQPTFLDCDEPYPDQSLSVIIWGRDRSEFPSPPEEVYRDEVVCVQGLIWTFGGKPTIVAHDGDQIDIASS
jgi:hypothetical protein